MMMDGRPPMMRGGMRGTMHRGMSGMPRGRGGMGMSRGGPMGSRGRGFHSSNGNGPPSGNENGNGHVPSSALKPIPAQTSTNNVQVATTGSQQQPPSSESSTTVAETPSVPKTITTQPPIQEISSSGGGGGGGGGGYMGREPYRGRGGFRGRGRGGPYMGSNPHYGGAPSRYDSNSGPPMRGRGSYNNHGGSLAPRPQFDTRQPSNTTTVTPGPMKRGPFESRGGMSAGGGHMMNKRGRFDGPPGGSRGPPRYNSGYQGQNYNPAHHSGGYSDQSHQAPSQDPYSGASSYGQPPPPTGSYSSSSYGQPSYGAPSYGAAPEYDQSQYQDYR